MLKRLDGATDFLSKRFTHEILIFMCDLAKTACLPVSFIVNATFISLNLGFKASIFPPSLEKQLDATTAKSVFSPLILIFRFEIRRVSFASRSCQDFSIRNQSDVKVKSKTSSDNYDFLTKLMIVMDDQCIVHPKNPETPPSSSPKLKN